MTHPARWTPAILEYLEREIRGRKLRWVHDPFGGTGERLGALADEVGVKFTGGEIEREFIEDPRVLVKDATILADYPAGVLSPPGEPSSYSIVTSPTYGNGVNDHFEAKDGSRRYTYRSALGRPLAPTNTGRYGVRGGKRALASYWELNEKAVECWRVKAAVDVVDDVYVNVKDFIHAGEVYPLVDMWAELLDEHGFDVLSRAEIKAPGIRHGANRDSRVECETVLWGVPR